MRGRLSSCTVALATTATLGAILLAGPAPAQSKPIEPQDNSLQSAIDDFVAYLKSETCDAASEAAKMARDHKATLSDQKARAETLASDAIARLGAWSKSAAVSWAEAERLSEDMLDRFTAWLRSQAPSDETSEIPV